MTEEPGPSHPLHLWIGASRRWWRIAFLAGILLFAAGLPGRAAREDPWARLDAVAQETVTSGGTPGVVFLVGHRGRIVYRKAFGYRSLQPEREPMTCDTVFDLASLTKVIATTSSVMALIEEGRLRLRDPVSRYWPEFGHNGKEAVTVRHLLTHSSGLAAGANFFGRLAEAGKGPVQDRREQALAILAELPLAYPTDTRQVYSDLGFITLGEVVRRASGEPLDRYAERRIFRPLKMRETAFTPGEALRRRAAPTTLRFGQMLRGDVHDPTSAVWGGVAGHAGLFSTADDLAKFARMLLSSDRRDRHRYPLSPATVRLMTSPQAPPGLPLRGLGWDIDSAYSHVRGDLMPLGTFGHTGFTGTYLWVDPYSQAFLIGLSNRVHPEGKGNVLPLWAHAASIVEGIVRPQALPPRGAIAR